MTTLLRRLSVRPNNVVGMSQRRLHETSRRHLGGTSPSCLIFVSNESPKEVLMIGCQDNVVQERCSNLSKVPKHDVPLVRLYNSLTQS